MGNTLSYYDPIFYAQEAIPFLRKALGMAGAVHRGYDRTPQQKGSTIRITAPSSFTVNDAPGSDQNIVASGVDITLNKWREVKFALTDKELTLSRETLISDHIAPAAYALANDIDQNLAALYKDVYQSVGTAGSTPSTLAAFLAGRKAMNDFLIPDDSQRFAMIDTAAEAKLLELLAGNYAAAGEGLRGYIGEKFGLKFFMNQNTPIHSNNSITGLGNATGTAGGTSVTLASVAQASGTIKQGTTFTISGSTQQFTVTADATVTTNAATISISPALPAGFSPSGAATTIIAGHTANLLFHKGAFALAMAPLSEMGNDLGAKIATITQDNISIRSRIWYDGNNSAVKVGLDVLYGYKTINPALAVRLLG